MSNKQIKLHSGDQVITHHLKDGEKPICEILIGGLLAAGHFQGLKIEEIFLFEEDGEDELPRATEIILGLKRLHAHRCKRIDVKVSYIGKSIDLQVTPGTTVRKLIAQSKILLHVEGEGKYDLRLDGAESEPLPLDAHIGSYSNPSTCSIHLYLTPTQRIQG